MPRERRTHVVLVRAPAVDTPHNTATLGLMGRTAAGELARKARGLGFEAESLLVGAPAPGWESFVEAMIEAGHVPAGEEEKP